MAGTDKTQIIYLGELGNPPILSGYLLLKNKKGALIESGPTSVVDEYIRRVKKYIEPEDLKYIFVSHIHLDHSGGSWKFVDEFPEIKVIVHEKGSKHLIDPKKLVEASKTALGKIYSYWGDPEPVPEKNIMPVGDQFFEPEFGIRIIYTPGHASHSTALYHEETGTLFPGDSAGMLLFGEGGKIWPAAPPPFFLDQFLESIKKLQKLKLSKICYPHYGCSGRPYAILEEAIKTYDYFALFLRERCENKNGNEVFEEIMKQEEFKNLPRSDYFNEFYKLNLRGFQGSCI